MSDALIEVHNCGKTFRSLRGGTVDALQDVSMNVNEGELLSIVGPSGCGKTTLLRMIGGLIQPTTGSVMVNGQELVGPVPDVGFVFQHPTLFPWQTVLGNVLLAIRVKKLDRKKHTDKALDMIRLVGLGDFHDKYPWELSGGMQQRVSIARALMNDPKLLLMDEPFGALDALTREEMRVELLRIWEKLKVTAVFVTHDVTEAVLLSERVITMSRRPGKIIKTFNIDLPRPRDLTVLGDARFSNYAKEIRRTLGLIN